MRHLHWWILSALLGSVCLYQALLGSFHRRAHASAPASSWTAQGDAPDATASRHRVVAVVLPASTAAAAPAAALPTDTHLALASFADGLILIGTEPSTNTAAAPDQRHSDSQPSTTSAAGAARPQLVPLRHSIPWQGDAAAALNQAADAAEAAGAAWLFVLRAADGLQVADSLQPLEQLSLTSSSILYCYITDGRLEAQACLFRLPLPGHFEGPVQPLLVPAPPDNLLLGAAAETSCWADDTGGGSGGSCSTEQQAELPAMLPLEGSAIAGISISPARPDPAELQQQLRALRRHLQARPPRKAWWLLQMARAYEAASNSDQAAQHYMQVFDASASRQLAAWAMFRLAVLHSNAGNSSGTLDAASKGLAVQVAPEGPWMASLASYRSSNMAQAIAWGEMAASIGCMNVAAGRCGLLQQPVVFAELSAWYEHPQDVLRYAYQEAGNDAAEEAAEAKYEVAKLRSKQLLAAATRGRQSAVIGGLQALAHLDEAQDACKPAGQAQAKPRPKVAASMTTAHRPELFRRSWHSFRARCLDCDSLVSAWFLVDDGSSPEQLAQMQQAAPPGAGGVTWLTKAPEQAGHVGSLNVVLDEVMRRGFDYLLHLEDDWFFIRDEEFVTAALAVMDADPAIGQVLLNPNYREMDADWEADGLHGDPELLTPDGVRYSVHTYAGPRGSRELSTWQSQHGVTKASHLQWPGFALRPGLWLLSAVARAGRFEQVVGFEEAFGLKLHGLGVRTAYLPELSCIHLAPASIWLQDKDVNAVFEKHGLRLVHRPNRPNSVYDSNAAER